MPHHLAAPRYQGKDADAEKSDVDPSEMPSCRCCEAGRIMFKNVNIDEVAEDLWVGQYPASPEFVTTLAVDVGITGLVSVQTDEDLADLGVNWPATERYLRSQNITVHRVPIRDFDARALEQGLEAAVVAVNFLRATGCRTYIHCTAGINRSPSVAIAYLIAHQEMSFDDAWEQVTSRRPSSPVKKALKRWHKAHLKSLRR